MFEIIRAGRHGARRLPVLFFGVLLVLASLAGCSAASAAASSPVAAASVDGHAVSLGDYQQMTTTFAAIGQLNSQTPGQGATDWQSPGGRSNLTQTQQQALNFLIDLQLARDELAHNHINVSQKSLTDAKNQLKAAVQSAAQQRPDVPVRQDITSHAIDVLAEQSADQTALLQSTKITVPAVHVRAIIVKTRQEAVSLQQQAEHGTDFGQLAKAHSLDSGTAAQGGEIGTVYLGQDSSFDKLVFLAPHVSKYIIVPNSGVYLLAEITQRSEKPLASISNQQTQQSVFSAWLSEVVRAHAHVEKYITVG